METRGTQGRRERLGSALSIFHGGKLRQQAQPWMLALSHQALEPSPATLAGAGGLAQRSPKETGAEPGSQVSAFSPETRDGLSWRPREGERCGPLSPLGLPSSLHQANRTTTPLWSATRNSLDEAVPGP